MSLTKPSRKQPLASGGENETRPDQKRCSKCGSLVARELNRCPFCGNAPWKWHQNSRLLIITLIICLFLFILFPILTNRDKPYRVPVTEEDTTP